MKKGLRILASAAVLTAGLTGAAFAADGKYTIGYDNYFMGNSWSVQLAAEFKAEAEKHTDKVNVVYVESAGDTQKQIANIEDLITKKVDAIITTPTSPTALIPALKKARAAGIKIVLLAATIKSQDYDALVTVDDVAFGRTGAEWLAQKLGGKGDIIALNGIAGISTSDDRFKGAEEVFAKYPDIKIVAAVNAGWDYAQGKQAVSNLLAANPKIDGVWSQGGAMTLGAIDAFEAAQRPLVPMTGEDNNGYLKRWKQLEDKGFDSIGTSKPTWLGSEALRVTIDLLDGKAVEKDMVLPVPTITAADLDKFVKPDLSDSFWAGTRLTDEQVKATFAN
ncbi:ABC transporter substrate-binding protein [Prosthecomicrobium pneumaticum]|uniref:Ribose transport system substrate-binding protein n=1 Tax=Prosthecomicrobium pneumaticum TaxID=81895 RepID=A0A7W9CU24_9HYPH|nr:ABC transporter substrate-binding protein [Prosthecomicrobium pneumaticum]MBB5751654.1 ribose transport system substrate-binding protein [Prosthecomicrobium pneumaticum]